jgi:hypothetical protein
MPGARESRAPGVGRCRAANGRARATIRGGISAGSCVRARTPSGSPRTLSSRCERLRCSAEDQRQGIPRSAETTSSGSRCEWSCRSALVLRPYRPDAWARVVQLRRPGRASRHGGRGWRSPSLRAPSAAARARRRAGARRRGADRDPTPTRPQQPRHHQRVPRHRQRRDHRHRPRPPRPHDPRQRIAPALNDRKVGAAHCGLRASWRAGGARRAQAWPNAVARSSRAPRRRVTWPGIAHARVRADHLGRTREGNDKEWPWLDCKTRSR